MKSTDRGGNMNPRKVIVTIEMISCAPLEDIEYGYKTGPNAYKNHNWNHDEIKKVKVSIVKSKK